MIKNQFEGRECLTFCIINYNGEKYLDETIRSVFKQKQARDEIILVDNASMDRSLEIVKINFPHVKIIPLNKNLGPGFARNVGFVSSSNDLILFLDNDVCLTNDCVKQLTNEFRRSPMAMAAMPCVLFADRPNIIQYDGADLHFTGAMLFQNANLTLDTQKDCRTRKINSIVTACFLMDRRRWSLGKPFDDDFFMYFEDHDFGLKIRINGFDILSVPTAHVLHREGTPGLSLREHGLYTSTRVYNNILNRWQIIIKFFSIRSILILLPVFVLFEIFQFAFSLKKGWMRDWSHALTWTVSRTHWIYSKRLRLQKNRKIHDREFLKNGPLPFAPELAQTRLEKTGIKILNLISINYWKYAKHFI